MLVSYRRIPQFMEGTGAPIIDSHAGVHKLHPIKEDEMEGIEQSGLDGPGSVSQIDKKHNQFQQGTSEQHKTSADEHTHSTRNANFFVDSMKKAITSLGSNASSSAEDFVHITDCLKDTPEMCSDQAEIFVPDLCLQLVMFRHGASDPELQEVLRNRLRLLENDNKEVTAVFSELSARLLSIHSDKDMITVTFKTFEEIWKFSTYYSLGFLNHCMENMFLDQLFWLFSPDEEPAGINVHVNEESLNLIYKRLLLEEGTFFVLCGDGHIRQAAVVDDVLQIFQSNSVVDGVDVGWTQNKQSVLGDTLVGSKTTIEPLCPFHQWFLKTNSVSDLVDFTRCKMRNKTAVGLCEALVDHEGEMMDEMSYKSGDVIETISTYFECMDWFLGRHITSENIGFVKTSNVKTLSSDTGQGNLEWEEILMSQGVKSFDLNNAKELLNKMLHSSVCNVFRLDELEDIKPSQQKETNHSANIDTNTFKQKLTDFFLNTQEIAISPDVPNDLQLDNINLLSKDAKNCENYEAPCFCISEGQDKQEALESLLLFLNKEKYTPGFKTIYDISYGFKHMLFNGYSEEGELIRYLSIARESAKKANMTWALTRICFLLGRLAIKRHKFSQARVYFEEAIGAVNGNFSDLFLIRAMYMNLTAVYLKQNNKEKCLLLIDKSASLILGLQTYPSSTDMDPMILKYVLRKAILNQDSYSEIRACLLLATNYISLKQSVEALPFIERLQVLRNKMESKSSSVPGYYFKLADIYNYKCLPHMALSSVKVASHSSSSFTNSLRGAGFVADNAVKLCGIKQGGQIFPTQIAHYLRNALASALTDQEQILCMSIYLSLSELCSNHKQCKKAQSYILKAVEKNGLMASRSKVDFSVTLAWLCMLDKNNLLALDILNSIMPLCICTEHQLGIIYNLKGIALRRTNEIKHAAEHYCKALKISRDTGACHNQAAVLANFGTLCLHLNAHILTEHFFINSIRVYSSIPSIDNGTDFIHVLLIFGNYYMSGIHKENARIYYEWAFLVAMETNHLESQLQATQLLCNFYNTVVINEAQCIIYNEYQLSLARKMADKVLEGQVLEKISQLYLSLGTERACKSALEYTKRSLGIFIDLQRKEKEAYAWLWAGKIYYILGQNELVDLYIQVAQNVALSTGDPNLGMELFEAAGDIFFNGANDREKAVSFYRDCALPLAVKTENVKAELRLCNKLTDLLINMKHYEECLEHAKISLALSVLFEDQLNERVAYHRLAVIYSHLGQCELAEHFYLKALSLCSSPLELEEEGVYYMKVYLILGDIIFYKLKDPFDATGYYNLALAAAVDLGNKKTQLKLYTRLAVIYHNYLIDREKSLYFYQKARTFAMEFNMKRINLSPTECPPAPIWTGF
ncbi:SH3 domain and tetratricopeptide repeat-containing 1 [Pelobates cultripes]|nr:SH3 domain and tetratricopeptide repeat-containing 1 [Pelobates cultripes]